MKKIIIKTPIMGMLLIVGTKGHLFTDDPKKYKAKDLMRLIGKTLRVYEVKT